MEEEQRHGTLSPGAGVEGRLESAEPSERERGVHLTSVGEKLMRTSRVTALLTFTCSAFSQASLSCSAGPADCSSLWGRRAVGLGDVGG